MAKKKNVHETVDVAATETREAAPTSLQPSAPAQPKKSGSCLKIAIVLGFLFFILILCVATIFGIYWFVIRDDGSDGDKDEKEGCTYNKGSYEDGDSFDAIDGCNTCSCEDGQVGCTLMACEESTTSTSSTAEEKLKDISFELLGDSADGLYPFNLEFSAEVPKTATVDETYNSVNVSEGAPYVTIEGDNFCHDYFDLLRSLSL